MRYSIIIPIFNAAETLPRCLDSLMPQIQDHIEILLINDGSTDGSGSICEHYAARYPQIRLFTKENGGVSSARNLGLEHAQGEYILFVDADDAVTEDYFTVLDSALRDEPALLMFGVQLVGGKRKNDRASLSRDFFCQNSECVSALASALRRQEFNLITTKAFRRDVIESNLIRFEECLDIGEDKVFSLSYAVQINQVRGISDKLYLLSMDGRDSLSRKKRDDLVDSVLLEHRILIETLEKADLPDKEKRVYNQAIQYSYYRSAYTVCRKAQQDGLSPEQRKQSTERILNAYTVEGSFRPSGLSCRLIALPVRMHWKNTVNQIVSFFLKEESK